MSQAAATAGLTIAPELKAFIEDEALPGTGIAPAAFWQGLAGLLEKFTPRNRDLLARRNELQARIDAWHRARRGAPVDRAAYIAFLTEIGYLVPPPAPFSVSTANVDAEIGAIAGPQLVVPVNNARYALNAANARWGSLYDALYGTDAIPDRRRRRARRAATTRSAGRAWSPRRARSSTRSRRSPAPATPTSPAMRCATARSSPAPKSAAWDWKRPAQFAGYQGEPAAPALVLLRHHGLHVELHIDRTHPIGRDDPAGVADVVLESAITTIMDLRGQHRRRRCRRQGRGLPQLARADARHARRHVREGRADAGAPAQSRPHLHARPAAARSPCPAAA